MAEFDPSRTYAIRKLQYALVDPKGQPLSLHHSVDQALGVWVMKRGGIILDAASRKRYFDNMRKAKYSIRRAFAWCRVGPDQIEKLPKEKKSPHAKRVRG